MLNRLTILQDFVKLKHEGQLRKYTGEPYYNHLYNVSQIAKGKGHLAEEIGLCHDLLEDTNCSEDELTLCLISIGYYTNECYFIVSCVKELTDKYTHEAYPHINRTERKRLEIDRLSKISITSQTVKYADIIDNCSTIFANDPNFSKVYLKEKQELLGVMREGDSELWQRAFSIVN